MSLASPLRALGPGPVRTALAAAAGVLALSLASQAAAQSVDLSGIWAPDQGVLWTPGVRQGERQRPPFTPTYAALYQEALDAAAAGRPKADPPAQCLPPGVPRIMASPFPFEIVQTRDTVYLLHEYMSQVRRVFLNDTAPKPLGFATYNGHSVGRWEGDALVVETTELVEGTVLDTTHLSHSDALNVVERFRRTGPDKLEVRITLVDPKAYVEPWTVTRTYTRKSGDRILQYICEENNRNPINEDGSTGFIGPQ